MTDVLTPEQRRRNMRAIRSTNTGPERVLTQMLRDRGMPYAAHDPNLLGKPDFVFKELKKAIFVHGCYWHMHRCRFGRVTPRTNATFWKEKRTANVARDQRTVRNLKAQGWGILVVWACWLKAPHKVERRVTQFLGL